MQRKEKVGGKAVSSYFKGQLDKLMVILYKTEPHFIHYVVPNTHKMVGMAQSDIIMESCLAELFAVPDFQIRCSIQSLR